MLTGLQFNAAGVPQGERRGEGGDGGRPSVRRFGEGSGQQLLSGRAVMEEPAVLWSVSLWMQWLETV